MFGQPACPAGKSSAGCPDPAGAPGSLETCARLESQQFGSRIWQFKCKIIIVDCLFQVSVNPSKCACHQSWFWIYYFNDQVFELAPHTVPPHRWCLWHYVVKTYPSDSRHASIAPNGHDTGKTYVTRIDKPSNLYTHLEINLWCKKNTETTKTL